MHNIFTQSIQQYNITPLTTFPLVSGHVSYVLQGSSLPVLYKNTF